MEQGTTTAGSLRLRDAIPEDAGALSGLAVRSKSHWGYDAAFMAACAAELQVKSHHIDTEIVRVAERGAKICGFYGLTPCKSTPDLRFFFVEPTCIGIGVGRGLWSDLVEQADCLRLDRVTIDADPFAEAFYLRMGAQRIGATASGSIPGRMLPRLCYTLRVA